MSGTSMDGIDGVAARITGEGRVLVLEHEHAAFEPALRSELLALNAATANELDRAALAANGLARAYADVVQPLATRVAASGWTVRAIGAHGQTVRHQPGVVDGIGYTIQLNNPALLAELTGIDVIADFRVRDLAAGGQGAPLAPGFHQAAFGGDEVATAVLNLGGIGNLTLLGPRGQPALGFDCGPGNALLDAWCEQHTGQAYDEDGRWSAGGTILPALLQSLLNEPYLDLPPPKSTGRDLFNPAWLQAHLRSQARDAPPRDVQATLAAYTVECAVRHLRRLAPAQMRKLVVCGGGALNGDLMHRLSASLPGWQVESSAMRGLPPLQVEAAAFAWLAWRFLEGLPGNLPSVTGAAGPRRLGALHPAH